MKDQIDENKLYLMIRLAKYEQRNRDRALRINKCFRSDYIGFASLRNFLLTTIAYLLLLVIILLVKLDFFLSNFNNINYVPLFAVIGVGYLVFLGVYWVISRTIASLRYTRAENSIRQYDRQLERLEDIYRLETHRKRAEKEQQGRGRK